MMRMPVDVVPRGCSWRIVSSRQRRSALLIGLDIAGYASVDWGKAVDTPGWRRLVCNLKYIPEVIADVPGPIRIVIFAEGRSTSVSPARFKVFHLWRHNVPTQVMGADSLGVRQSVKRIDAIQIY